MEAAKVAMVGVETRAEEGASEVTRAHALEGLKVHFISLVGNPANKRAFLVKAAALDGLEVVEKQVKIVRKDAKRRMVYGVVLAPNEVDDEQDTITAEEIEKSAYAFMQGGRTQQIDTDHSTEIGAGFVAESWIVRAGDPLFAEETPGTWVVGVKVTDDATWSRVEKEELLGFSVGGVARRVPVEIEVAPEDPDSGSGGAVDKQADAGGRSAGGAMFKDVVDTGAAIDRVEKSMEQQAEQTEESVADRFIAKVRKALGVDETAEEHPKGTSHGAPVDKGTIRVEIQEKKSEMAADDEQETGTDKRVDIQEVKSQWSGKTVGEAIMAAREAEGLSASDVSELMRGDGARSASTIGQIERGEITEVPDETLDEFARVLPGLTAAGLKKLRDGGNESVEKSFKEKLLQNQTWQITDALSQAIRDILRDEDETDKVGKVNEVIEEFQMWLEGQMSQAVAKFEGRRTKGEGSRRTRDEGRLSKDKSSLDAAVQKAVAPLGEQIESLTAELEAVASEHGGRQTALGGDDGPVEKQLNGKGYKGLPIKL